MNIAMTTITPNIRELPVSLKLNNNNNEKFIPPIKSDGYIINPNKFKDQIKDYEMSLKEIKALLLMMIKGNTDSISKLLNVSGHLVNTLA